jgi:hypothetical protein
MNARGGLGSLPNNQLLKALLLGGACSRLKAWIHLSIGLAPCSFHSSRISFTVLIPQICIKGTVEAVKACPREIFNFWLFFCTAVWSFCGVAKGFDEGSYCLHEMTTSWG